MAKQKNYENRSAEVIEPTIVFKIAEHAFNSGKRKLFLQGSSRSGKTFNFTIWYISKAYMSKSPLKVIVVRSTYPRLKRTTFKDFKDVMVMMGIWEQSHYHAVDHEYEFDNGSTISFFATEDFSVAQGLKSDILFINEATEIAEEVYRQLVMRCTTFVAIDYNPNFSDDHWIKKEIINPKNKDILTVSRTTYKDNPHLPKEVVDEIESLRETNPRLWTIYGLGEQCLVEGLVYDEFEVMDKFPAEFENRAGIGIDPGYKDPFAVVKVYPDAVSKRLYVQEICYKSLLNEEQQIDILLREDVRHRLMICDSIASQFIDTCRKRYGLRIRKAIKSSISSRTSILPGIACVSNYRIVVCGDSPNLERELRNYTYKLDRNGSYTNEPIDSFNHLLDAMRYYVFTTNPRRRTDSGIRIIR